MFVSPVECFGEEKNCQMPALMSLYCQVPMTISSSPVECFDGEFAVVEGRQVGQ